MKWFETDVSGLPVSPGTSVSNHLMPCVVTQKMEKFTVGFI
jgi:hypothetical protein